MKLPPLARIVALATLLTAWLAAAPAAQAAVGSTPTPSLANCVAAASTAVTHNGWYPTLGRGGDPSHGARGEEIQWIHATCSGSQPVASSSSIAAASAQSNCIATASSSVTHNGWYPTLGRGGDPSHGARGAELRQLQATCGGSHRHQ